MSVISEEMRRVIRDIIGNDRHFIWMMRKVLTQLQAEADDAGRSTS